MTQFAATTQNPQRVKKKQLSTVYFHSTLHSPTSFHRPMAAVDDTPIRYLRFAKGTSVEVNRTDDVSKSGAWYTATILEPPSPPPPLKPGSRKRKLALVVYAHLFAEGGSKLLTEYVDPANLRPVPPINKSEKYKKFEEDDIVDLKWNDGWWPGVVKGILGDGKYKVELGLGLGMDVKEVDEKDLRLHWDWVHGKWVKPVKGKDQNEQSNGSNSYKRKRGRPKKLVIMGPKISEADKKETGTSCAVSEELVIKYSTRVTPINTGKNHEESSPERKVVEAPEQNCYTKEVEAFGTLDQCVFDENKNLLFVKSSPIWKAIDAMEIFRMLPQKPHFRPLCECKEQYREGSAIGTMVTFTGLVEEITKLRFDDPRSSFNCCLETLSDLEKHGFDVTALRSRVNDLLAIKDRHVHLKAESKNAEDKIAEIANETKVLDEKVAEIEKQINELREKHAAIKLARGARDLELARLKLLVDVNSSNISNAQSDYEKLAALPFWKSM